MNKRLYIDPGLHSAGYAIFKGIQPIKAGLIKPDAVVRESDLLIRANNVGRKFAKLVEDEGGIEEAWTEFPVSYGAADSRAGEIQKLCACIGAIAGHLHPMETKVVLVPEWKGQLPKPVVIKRIKQILTPYLCEYLKLDKDMWDAIGIGLYKVGRFK